MKKESFTIAEMPHKDNGQFTIQNWDTANVGFVAIPKDSKLELAVSPRAGLVLEQSGVGADGRETQENRRSVVEREKGRAGCLTQLLGPGNPCPGLVSQLCLFPSRTDPVSIS